MKCRITGRGIPILMAIMLLALLPIRAINENVATPTDQTPVLVTLMSEPPIEIANGKIKITLTSKEQQTAETKLPSVSDSIDTNTSEEIKQKMAQLAETIIRPQLTTGQTYTIEHFLRKIGSVMFDGGVLLKIDIIGLDSKTKALTAVYNKTNIAEQIENQYDINEKNEETFIDFMLITISEQPATPAEDQQGNENMQNTATDSGEQAGSGNDNSSSQNNSSNDNQIQNVSTDSELTNNSNQTQTTNNDNNTAQTRENVATDTAAQSQNIGSNGPPSGAVSDDQFTDHKVEGGTESKTTRDPNLMYAPDGTVYNPDTGNDAKPTGQAIGGSFNILDPVSTSGNTGTVSSSAVTGGIVTEASEADTEEEEAVTVGTETVGNGYNVVLIGLKESNTKSETWSLLDRNGIVFEDFRSGEGMPADTEELMQSGMDGIRKEDDPEYWDSPSAAKTVLDLIYQFGFYAIIENEQKESDAQVLHAVTERLANEGLLVNDLNMPFFLEIQLTGNSGDRDSLADLILEMEANGLGSKTVLLFALTGQEGEENPLILVHPAIQKSMTVRTPARTEDVLATILPLSGGADAAQYEILSTLPGRNLLTVKDFNGLKGLVPELAKKK